MNPTTGGRSAHVLDVALELRLGLKNLRVHKLRASLTMLGMIFGVAAVVAMLSIGAGAQQEVIAFIEQLGVRNVIVEARETTDQQELQRIRRLSAGLSFVDMRMIEANLTGLEASSARKRVAPSGILPKPQGDPPVVFGVSTQFMELSGLSVAAGRFFNDVEADNAAPVAVLGQGAASSLFGNVDPIGKFVKANQQWFRVIGLVGPQLTVQAGAGLGQHTATRSSTCPSWRPCFDLKRRWVANATRSMPSTFSFRRRRTSARQEPSYAVSSTRPIGEPATLV